MDQHGWVKMDDLVYALFSRDSAINRSFIEEVVARNDKQRFKISDDGKYIRANQGHSIPVDLGLEPQIPPDKLYHGTAQKSVHAIQKTGIVQDFGVFDTPDAFYFSHEQSFGWLRGALYRHIIRHWMNARVRGFRSDRLKTDRRATHAHEEPANAT